MRKVAVMALAVGMSMLSHAGSFLVHVRMPDQTVLTFELPSVPKPDQDGLFRFHVKGRTNQLVVHVSNVWIEEKGKK